MGYYRRYYLDILQGGDANIDYQKEICDMAEYEHLFDDETKWYNHDEDMLSLSKKHPKVLFLLDSVGEEDGDMWRKYYMDGKTTKIEAQIVFEEFDLTKLK